MKKVLITFFIAFMVLHSFSAQALRRAEIYPEPKEMDQIPFYKYGGKTVYFQDFRGHFLVVVFWSKDCFPCIKELPTLASFAQEAQSKGIKVIAITPFGEWYDFAEIKQFLADNDSSFLTPFADKKGNVATNLGIFSYPHTVLINRQGYEIGRIRGALNWMSRAAKNFVYKLNAED